MNNLNTCFMLRLNYMDDNLYCLTTKILSDALYLILLDFLYTALNNCNNLNYLNILNILIWIIYHCSGS